METKISIELAPEPKRPGLSAQELRNGEIVVNGAYSDPHHVTAMDLRLVTSEGVFALLGGYRGADRTSVAQNYYRLPKGTKITLEVQ